MAVPRNVTTKAYVVAEKGAPFLLQDVILDEVKPNEVLVEIKYTGVCHTDLVVQQGGMPAGGYPVVLGHEGVGIVRYVGSNCSYPGLDIGDTVSLSFVSCRNCPQCSDGRCGSCPLQTENNFLKMAGRSAGEKSPISLPDGSPVVGQFFGQSSLGKMAIVAEMSVVKIDASSEDLPFLAPLSCGYMSGAGAVFNVLKPKTTDKVVILGMGAVGLASLLAAKALGVKDLVAVDILESKLDLALELGASRKINSKSSTDLELAIKSIFPAGADKILDATGVASLLTASVKSLAHDGTLAMVGVPPPTATFKINALDFLLSCKKVVGVIEGQADPREMIPSLIRMYKDGNFPIDRLCKIYPADSFPRAIDDLKSGHVVKPILSWENT